MNLFYRSDRSVRYALTIVFSTVLLLSCEEHDTADPLSPLPDYNVSAADKALFEGLPFNTENLAKLGNDYLVEGDMIVTPDVLRFMRDAPPADSGARTSQYRIPARYFVSESLKTIRIRVTSGNAKLLKAVDQAISNYNSVNLSFQMKRVTTTNEHIRIDLSSNKSPNNFRAQANFPSGNGKPGSRILVWQGGLSGDDNQVERTLTHELGHTLGLQHTDYFNPALSCNGSEESQDSGRPYIGVPGTVRFDPLSVMNTCARPGTFGELSFYDKVALRFMY